jgi:hypothetical protein
MIVAGIELLAPLLNARKISQDGVFTRDKIDRYILLRSSKQFLPGDKNSPVSSAATSMLVQMNSGMVITLLVYPIREIDKVVHRCVVRYDRDSIVKARQAAGLAVNLDQREEPLVSKSQTSIQMLPPPKSLKEASDASASSSEIVAEPTDSSRASVADENGEVTEKTKPLPIGRFLWIEPPASPPASLSARS